MTTLRLRPLELADLADVHALHRRSEAHDRFPRVLELDELWEEFDGTHVDPPADARVAEVEGRLVGYLYTYHLPSDVDEEACYLFGCVDPDHRRAGVGSALVAWGVDRATERLLASPHELPRFVRVEQFEPIDGAAALFAAHGFEPVRWTDELIRPLDDIVAGAAGAASPMPLPDGVRIVAWPHERSEEIRLVKNESFADHWGTTPASPESWRQRTEGFGARLDLSCVALGPDDEVIGFSLAKRFEADDELLGRSEAWIDNLGTLAAWRRKGVASALIAHALRAFADAGLTHAALGVDTENPTGAAGLYASLGFVPAHRFVVHQRRVGRHPGDPG